MRAQARTFLPGAGDASRPAGRRRAAARSALPATLLALAVLAGCAPAPSQGGVAPSQGGAAPGEGGATDGVGRAEPPPSGSPQTALARWQSFPASASPRPVVLTGGMVLDPSAGFATDEDKLAYLAGRYELGVALPSTAPPASDGYAVISATAALDRLRVNVSGQQVDSPLRIVKASLTRAKFITDRGPQLLPAWQFALAGVSDSVRVLALAQSRLWPVPQQPTWSQEQAGVAADDQTLTYSFFGSPSGPSPCGAEYAGQLTEARTAVVLSVREVKPNPAGSSSSAEQACPAIAAQRTVTVRLATPLGGRVLLTSEGAPISVARS